MRRRPEHWRTPLGSFVDDVGARRIADGLGRRLGYRITVGCVYKWIAGRTVPRPNAALALVDLSGGRLSLGDLVHHRAVLSRQRDRQRASRRARGTGALTASP